MTESSGVVGAIRVIRSIPERKSPVQESGGKTEVGRRRIGVEGESFFITLLSGHDIRQNPVAKYQYINDKCSVEKKSITYILEDLALVI